MSATLKNVFLRRRQWWFLLAAYLFVFLVTGYIAFIAKDPDIPLMQRVNTMTAGMPDAETKAALIGIFKQEENEHETKAEMAAQAFHIVLGSLIGFLSASAIQVVPWRKRE